MQKQRRILAVDDEQLILWSIDRSLSKDGYEVRCAATCEEAWDQFREFEPDAILLDLRLPDGCGMELIPKFREIDDDVIIIVISSNVFAETAVEALSLGAEDFVGKPFDIDEVKHTLSKALEKKRLKERVARLSQGLRKKSEFDQLIGNSPKMIELLKMVHACGRNDCRTVLVLGDSGTGKELIARAIHRHSARAEEPFLDINCSAIPEHLLENELFGHEKGAYTDASDRQRGIFELAEGGTIFLDEIGDMPLPMQTKILKVIETNRFRRLGGKGDIQANVRIIAATNQDLRAMVAEGRFRGDLFYRLNVMTFELPSLRERKEDIVHLVEYFIARLNEEYGRSVKGVSPEALEDLVNYDWPGNVRELRNAIERAMMLEGDSLLTSDFLPCEIRRGGEDTKQTAPVDGVADQTAGMTGPFVLPEKGVCFESLEKDLIRQALQRHRGNQTLAAKCLHLSRDTLRYRMKKFGLDEDEFTAAEGGEADVGTERYFDPHYFRSQPPHKKALP